MHVLEPCVALVIVPQELSPFVHFRADLPQQRLRCEDSYRERPVDQGHACLFRRSIVLPPVARRAGSNKILPRILAALTLRDDVLKLKLRAIRFLAPQYMQR